MTLPILVKDGIHYSSLEPLPEKPKYYGENTDSLRNGLRIWYEGLAKKYDSDLSQWRIEVEDQEAVKPLMPEESLEFTTEFLGTSYIVKDGLYFIEVKEAEVVEQWNANGIWLDRPEHRQGTPIYQETKYEYRKVLRIKP